MFKPFQKLVVVSSVVGSRAPSSRRDKPRRTTIYAFAATSIGVVSSAIPGPMLELR